MLGVMVKTRREDNCKIDFQAQWKNGFPLIGGKKKGHSTFQEYMNYRIAALAGTLGNHSIATSYTNSNTMEVTKRESDLPRMFYGTQSGGGGTV